MFQLYANMFVERIECRGMTLQYLLHYVISSFRFGGCRALCVSMLMILPLCFERFRWDSTFKRDYKMGQVYNCMV